jgi:hypothetical protein
VFKSCGRSWKVRISTSSTRADQGALKKEPGKDIMIFEQVGRGATHATRVDRRISVRRRPDPSWKRPAVAQQGAEELEAGSLGRQEVPSGNVMLRYARARISSLENE